MNTIKITLPNNQTLEIPINTLGLDLISYFPKENTQTVAMRINNEVCSLLQPLSYNANISPVLLNSTEGAAIYRRTLCFILGAAAYSIFPKFRLLVGHSLGHGYYYTLDLGRQLKQEDIDLLSNKMHEIIDNDISITQSAISYNDALELFKALNLVETQKQLRYICQPKFIINSILGFSDLYFGPLLPSTGILKVFELKLFGEGFLLRFPPASKPNELTAFEDVPKLFNIYKQYKEWGKMVNVTSAASLNELVYERRTKEFIQLTENFQTKHLSNIADQIKKHSDVKLVLMAGPSSSGKTTTSKKLSLQLQVVGYVPKVIELDSYFVGRDKTPKNEKGEYDYECLEALDIKQFNDDLVNLFAGNEINLPSYDFKEGKRYYTNKTMRLSEKDILVVEGIHGLNDKLTPLIPRENKFKIYLSALTQLNLDDHNRIPTSDNRLIRRIVRDSQFRGKTAAQTIKMWNSVQQGERLHIFPFQNQADAMLNTALDYELPVLKVYAEPLLRAVSPYEVEYSEACRLLRFLNNFLPIPVTDVPGQSIIREFIGNSDFRY